MFLLFCQTVKQEARANDVRVFKLYVANVTGSTIELKIRSTILLTFNKSLQQGIFLETTFRKAIRPFQKSIVYFVFLLKSAKHQMSKWYVGKKNAEKRKTNKKNC